MSCEHKNTDGPYFLTKKNWVEGRYSYVFDFEAAEVWICKDCGVVTAKQENPRESDHVNSMQGDGS
jgi:rubrerythrin